MGRPKVLGHTSDPTYSENDGRWRVTVVLRSNPSVRFVVSTADASTYARGRDLCAREARRLAAYLRRRANIHPTPAKDHPSNASGGHEGRKARGEAPRG